MSSGLTKRHLEDFHSYVIASSDNNLKNMSAKLDKRKSILLMWHAARCI